MQDLDFDELDRAVNSAISSRPAPQVPARPVGGLPTIPVVPSTPSAPRPSTGRFMDVVHPSSNMRSTIVMPERTSNQMANLPTQQLPVVQKSSSDDDSDIDQINNDISNSINQTTDKPLDSPFISGTKVDKRPLNAFSDEMTNTAPFQSTMSSPYLNSFKTTSEDSSIVTDTPLPAELQSDLLLIESNEMSLLEEPSDVPLITTAKLPVVVQPVAKPVINEKPILPVASSIPQQYKEQPNSGEKTNGAIYDVNSYHKAIVNPVKKKSGWMWVFWIVILMVFSVGAGVAVYYFVLPSL